MIFALLGRMSKLILLSLIAKIENFVETWFCKDTNFLWNMGVVAAKKYIRGIKVGFVFGKSLFFLVYFMEKV